MNDQPFCDFILLRLRRTQQFLYSVYIFPLYTLYIRVWPPQVIPSFVHTRSHRAAVNSRLQVRLHDSPISLARARNSSTMTMKLYMCLIRQINTQSEHALTVIENANVTRRRAKMLPLTWRSEPWLSTCVRKRRARRHGCGIENCYWGSNMERQRALWEFNSWRDREREGHRKTVKENIAADCEQLSGKLSGFDVRSTIYDAG